MSYMLTSTHTRCGPRDSASDHETSLRGWVARASSFSEAAAVSLIGGGLPRDASLVMRTARKQNSAHLGIHYRGVQWEGSAVDGGSII